MRYPTPDYTLNSYLNDKVATALVIRQRPGSNALATAATASLYIKDALLRIEGVGDVLVFGARPALPPRSIRKHHDQRSRLLNEGLARPGKGCRTGVDGG
jgi:hypothetical protein